MLGVRIFTLVLLVFSCVSHGVSASDINAQQEVGTATLEKASASVTQLLASQVNSGPAEQGKALAAHLKQLSPGTVDSVVWYARGLRKNAKTSQEDKDFLKLILFSAEAIQKAQKKTEPDAQAIDPKEISDEFKKAFWAELKNEKKKEDSQAEEPKEEKAKEKKTTKKPAAAGDDDVDSSKKNAKDDGDHPTSGPLSGSASPSQERPVTNDALENWLSGLGMTEPGQVQKVKNWIHQLKDENTRWDAAKKLLNEEKIWTPGLKEKLDSFGLDQTSKDLLADLYTVRTEKDSDRLRVVAHAETSNPTEQRTVKAARAELTRRTNQTNKENNWMNSAFTTVRPEALLGYRERIKSEEPKVAARALAELIGTLAPEKREALLKTLDTWGKTVKDDAALTSFLNRIKCADSLALKQESDVCEKDLAEEFKTAFADVTGGHKKFHEVLAQAGEDVEAARKWIFDPQGGNYTEENLMDYLGQRVQSCEKGAEAEKAKACQDAVNLAKVLGWKDKEGNWNLNLTTRDAGTKSDDAHVVQLGGKDDIEAGLIAFSKRGKDDKTVPDTESFRLERGNNRSRFQSYGYAKSHDAEGQQEAKSINAHWEKSKPGRFKVADGKVGILPDSKRPWPAEVAKKTTPSEEPTETTNPPSESSSPPPGLMAAEDLGKKVLADSEGAKCAMCHDGSDKKAFFNKGDVDANIADFKSRIQKKSNPEKFLDNMIERAGDITPEEAQALKFYAGLLEAPPQGQLTEENRQPSPDDVAEDSYGY